MPINYKKNYCGIIFLFRCISACVYPTKTGNDNSTRDEAKKGSQIFAQQKDGSIVRPGVK